MPTQTALRTANLRHAAWLLVALAAFLTFAPALGADWLWDDHFFFDPLAPALRSPAQVAEVFSRDLFGASTLGQKQHTYRPLTVWAWAWVVALTGGKAWALHAWSLVLHSAASVLVLELALALGAPLAAATLAGLAFAASTAQTEAAEWVSAVHGVAETAFVLGAVLATLRLQGWRRPAVAAACAAGALLCKESGLLAVLASLAFAVATLHPGALKPAALQTGALQNKTTRRELASLTGALAAVVVAYLGWRAHLDLPVGRPPFSAQGVLSLASALGQALLLPAWPDVCRPLQTHEQSLPGTLGLLAALGLLLWRSPTRRTALAALGLALASLLLLGPIAAQTTIASDRYLYLPQALIWATAAAALPSWELSAIGPRAKLALGVVLLWLLVRAGLAALSVADLRDDVAAFTYSASEHPENPETHYHLGVALLREHRTEPALAALERGRALRPGDPRIWSNLTGLLVNAHRDAQAMELIAPFDAQQVPSAKAAYNLALAASRLGNAAEATRLAQRALALDPGYGRAKALLAPR